METYNLTITLKDGEIILETIYADSLKEAKQIVKQEYSNIKSISL